MSSQPEVSISAAMRPLGTLVHGLGMQVQPPILKLLKNTFVVLPLASVSSAAA